MLVTVTVALHCGGRLNHRFHTITLDLEVPAECRTVLYRTLKQRCCQQLQLQPHHTLSVANLEFATVEADCWTPLPGNSVVLGEQQQQLTLSAVVVPAAVAAGPYVYPPPPVALMELARGPVPWAFCACNKSSSTDKKYDILIEEQPWDPKVLDYLQGKLQQRTMIGRLDPRFASRLDSLTTNEDQLNHLFNEHVCRSVDCVAQALGYDVIASKEESMAADQGQPNFLFKFGGKSLLTGEGKVPSVMRSAQTIKNDSFLYLQKYAAQEAFYINEQKHSYGFLTHMHGTFAFARKGENKYAITRSIPWHKTGAGVIAHILYMVLKQIDILDGIWDNDIWVPTVHGVEQQQQQLLQERLPPGIAAAVTTAAGLPVAAAAQAAGPAFQQQQQLGWVQQAQVDSAAAGYTDPQAAALGHSTQQLEQARVPQPSLASSDCSSSSTLLRPDGGYLHLNRDALQLTDFVIGKSQSGTVKLGMCCDTWCAVKVADVHNQKPAVRGMKHEVAMYLDDRLKGLQGEVLPHLVGCGYWKDGHLFVVATTYINACQKPGAATRAGATAAEQALQRLHQQGLLHGDLHRHNVLLRRLSDDEWQAYLIDLGMCHEAEDESAFEEEMKQLQDLFSESDTGSGEIPACSL